MMPCSKGLRPRALQTKLRRLQFATSGDFRLGLIPLHSPLLRESWLVSFPPLSYMLKFSGSSCVTEAQRLRHLHRTGAADVFHKEKTNLSAASFNLRTSAGWNAFRKSLVPRLKRTGRDGATRAALGATTNPQIYADSSRRRLHHQDSRPGVMCGTSTPSRMPPGISRKRKMRSKV